LAVIIDTADKNKQLAIVGGTHAARRKLSLKVEELVKERDGGLPIWIRAPVRGPEHYTGLTRAKLYQLVAAGLIESASLREPGQIKGVRLFNLASILLYIEQHAAPQGVSRALSEVVASTSVPSRSL
jgi:hypothetical protein